MIKKLKNIIAAFAILFMVLNFYSAEAMKKMNFAEIFSDVPDLSSLRIYGTPRPFLKDDKIFGVDLESLEKEGELYITGEGNINKKRVKHIILKNDDFTDFKGCDNLKNVVIIINGSLSPLNFFEIKEKGVKMKGFKIEILNLINRISHQCGHKFDLILTNGTDIHTFYGFKCVWKF